MSEPITREELATNLAERFAELDGLLNRLNEPQLTLIGVTDEWSVRDLLAHLTWWQQRVLARMRGEPASFQQEAGESDEAFWQRVNAAAVAAMRHEPADKVLRDFRASHQQMVQTAAALTDAQLADENLINSIIGNTYGHYAEHMTALRAFVGRQQH